MPEIEKIAENLRLALSSQNYIPRVKVEIGRNNPLAAWWTGERKDYATIFSTDEKGKMKAVGRVEMLAGGLDIAHYRIGDLRARAYNGMLSEKEIIEMAKTGKYSERRGSTVIVNN